MRYHIRVQLRAWPVRIPFRAASVPGSSLLLKGRGRHSRFTDGAAEAGVTAQGHTASRWRSWDLSPSLCLGLPQHRRPLWETEAGGGS